MIVTNSHYEVSIHAPSYPVDSYLAHVYADFAALVELVGLLAWVLVFYPGTSCANVRAPGAGARGLVVVGRVGGTRSCTVRSSAPLASAPESSVGLTSFPLAPSPSGARARGVSIGG